VQIAEYDDGRRKIMAHVGSARTEAELGILIERAREMLADPAQGAFDLGIEPAVPRARLVAPAAAPALSDAEPRDAAPAAARSARVVSTDSRLLFQALDGIYDDLGFDALGDDVFRDLVLARVIEPTSILDTGRVLADLGHAAAGDKTIGSQGRGARAGPFPHPPFNPYVRFSRIRLTDDLPGMVTPPSDSGWCRAGGAGRAR